MEIKQKTDIIIDGLKARRDTFQHDDKALSRENRQEITSSMSEMVE